MVGEASVSPKEPALDIGTRIEEIIDRHWRFRNLKPTTLVPILEAAHCFRDHQRRAKGIEAEAAALAWFWDRFAESLLNGKFDGDAKLYVLDNPGIFGTRRRPESEYGYRITSDHMRALTDKAFKYEDVVGRCLSRAWSPLQIAADWCEDQGLPHPARWRVQPKESRDNLDPGPAAKTRQYASKEAIQRAYQNRVDTWPKNSPHPSEEDDRAHLEEILGKQVGRDLFRQIRRAIAPSDWTAKGRPRGTKSAEI